MKDMPAATNTSIWIPLLTIIGVAACIAGDGEGGKDSESGISDSGSTGIGIDVTSYCEVVCDWATACVDGTASSIPQDELYAACLAATEAVDPGCSGAEDTLAAVEVLLLSECNADQIEQDCSAFTGSETDLVKATPPVATCMIGYGGGTQEAVDAMAYLPDAGALALLNDIQVYETYNVARNAVLESGAMTCERWEQTICGYATDCIAEKTGANLDQEYVETTTDACVNTVFADITDECISRGQWDTLLPSDYNPARFAAEACMAELDEDVASDGTCALFTSAPPAICAGAYLTDPSQVETIFSRVIDFADDQGASF